MKIGPFNITRNNKASEKYKAAYDPVGSSKPKRQTFYSGQVSWKSRCAHYDQITEQYSLAKVAPFTLAGLVTAQGVFFKPNESKPKKEEKAAADAEAKLLTEAKFEAYKIAEDAVYFTEKFARDQQVNSKFYETVWRCAKYGGCFWEITDTPTFGFRIPTLQECIEPAEADDKGNILKWRQVVNGTTAASLPL